MSRLFAYSRSLGITGAACALLLLGTWSQVFAQVEGESDLDEATQLKLIAQSMADLERVVELCESALEKGLDDESGKLAKSLMTATLYQHASRFAQRIFDRRARSERWPALTSLSTSMNSTSPRLAMLSSPSKLNARGSLSLPYSAILR